MWQWVIISLFLVGSSLVFPKMYTQFWLVNWQFLLHHFSWLVLKFKSLPCFSFPTRKCFIPPCCTSKSTAAKSYAGLKGPVGFGAGLFIKSQVWASFMHYSRLSKGNSVEEVRNCSVHVVGEGKPKVLVRTTCSRPHAVFLFEICPWIAHDKVIQFAAKNSCSWINWFLAVNATQHCVTCNFVLSLAWCVDQTLGGINFFLCLLLYLLNSNSYF